MTCTSRVELIHYRPTRYEARGSRTRVNKINYKTVNYNIDTDWASPMPLDSSQSIAAKLEIGMLTPAGLTSVHLGKKGNTRTFMKKNKSETSFIGVGVSGGGLRALAAHMGTFRALSNAGVLSQVNTFSSVSGGSWFLLKLSFDNAFARMVFDNKVPVAMAVSQWFEEEYYAAIRNLNRTREVDPDALVRSFVTRIIDQAPGPIRSVLGNTMMVIADHFDFSWQDMVEQTILGHHVAHQKLTDAEIASETRAHFGQEFTLALNWNQLSQWEDGNYTLWFLKEKSGEQTSHVQYPVYTSAMYKQSRNGAPEVEIKARGTALEKLFQVCQTQKEGNYLQHSFHQKLFRHRKAKQGVGLNAVQVVFAAKALVVLCAWILGLHAQPLTDPAVVVGMVVIAIAFYTGAAQTPNLLVCSGCTGLSIFFVSCFLWTLNRLVLPTKFKWKSREGAITAVGLFYTVVVPPMCAIVTLALLVPGKAISVALCFAMFISMVVLCEKWEHMAGYAHLLALQHMAIAIIITLYLDNNYKWEIYSCTLLVTPIMCGLIVKISGHTPARKFMEVALISMVVFIVVSIVRTPHALKECFGALTFFCTTRSAPVCATFGAVIGFIDIKDATTKTLIESTPASFKQFWTGLAFSDYGYLTRKVDIISRKVNIFFMIISAMFALSAVLSAPVCLLLWTYNGGIPLHQILTKTATTVTADCDFNLSFDGLTIGQVASASSAAAGVGAVHPWVQNLIELGQYHSPPCPVVSFVSDRVSDDENVTDEFLKLVGCQQEPSAVTAARWSEFLRGMAIEMDVSDSHGERKMSHHMAVDAVRQQHT